MSFTRLLNHTVSVQRLTATTGVKRTYQGSTSYACMIQPLDDTATPQTGMAFGKGYKCYADYTSDIREGDQITDQDGRKFMVRGVKKRNYGSFPHLDMLIEEDKRP